MSKQMRARNKQKVIIIHTCMCGATIVDVNDDNQEEIFKPE